MTRHHFPGSVKVMRMLSVFYEAKGEIDKAQPILLDLIEANAADGQSVKRLIALFRDMHMYKEAIAICNKKIEVN